MLFRTEISVGRSEDFLITQQSKILTIGSCFSDVIGSKLIDYKFNTLVNPFGTVYNPMSIFSLVEGLNSRNLVQRDGSWYSYNHHSEIKASTEKELEVKLHEVHQEVETWLATCDFLIITLGTALIYKLKDADKYVANCHKMPAVLFNKSMLTVAEITDGFKSLYNHLKRINPKIKVIFTVSPVRHIKDTIELNSVSKSILRLACHELVNAFEDLSYFPSYEIMMDDLRDYRFYKPDMIHPNEVAEEYIWQKWNESLFDDQTKAFIKDWDEILNAINHKPFDQEGAQYQAFINKYLTKLEQFKAVVPVESEINYFKSKLK